MVKVHTDDLERVRGYQIALGSPQRSRSWCTALQILVLACITLPNRTVIRSRSTSVAHLDVLPRGSYGSDTRTTYAAFTAIPIAEHRRLLARRYSVHPGVHPEKGAVSSLLQHFQVMEVHRVVSLQAD